MRCPLTKDTINTPFRFDKVNIFKNDNIDINMKAFSLYEPIMFHYDKTDSLAGVYGNVHHVHYNNTPVHNRYTLAIKANIPDKIKEKVYIATTDMKGNFWYTGGKWRNNFLQTKTREFGDFCIVADTIQPKITGLNIYPGKVLKKQNSIKLIIKDDESGIKSFRGEINGRWILMDYDHKRNLLRFDIDKSINQGENTFKLKVIDNVGNIKTYKAKFTY